MYKFKTAIYCRISHDDLNQQSESIDNQKLIIESYINEHKNEFELVNTYIDDGISGMTMWLGTFGAQFAAMPGVDPGALHRILVASSTTFDSLPHSPMLAQGMGVFKTDFKESYKYSFVLTVLFPVIFSLVGVVIAIIFY